MTSVAAVDCGTNAIRLLLVEQDKDGCVHEVARRMEIVRLGEGVDKRLGVPVTTAPATGYGKRDIAELAADDAYLLPLFVTRGLLLDRAYRMWRGPASEPLGTDLAPVVAQRYAAALATLTTHEGARP